MSRTRLIAIFGTIALLLALVPVLEHGSPPPEGRLASGLRPATADTAGPTRVTPAMQATIRRAVGAAHSPRPAVVARLSALLDPRHSAHGALARPLRIAQARSLSEALVRCATFDAQRYCLGQGWTDRTGSQVRSQVAAALSRLTGRDHLGTGALSPLDTLLQRARQSPRARAAAERAELTAAARSVAKVWLLRHELQGVPLPPDFLQHHPEAAVPVTASATGRGAASAGAATSGAMALSAATHRRPAYPASYKILSAKRVSEQVRTYWCGVASMQMIAWNWAKKKRSQRHWARRLHTTTDGTAMSDMVRVINQDTGWDNKRHAGPYISLDLSDWTYQQWWRLIEKHISKYHAPVVLNPILLKKYFPYLDHDESGHFQVGRGYARRPKRYNLIGYFEPFNQQRFDPSEPFIARSQWRSAYRSYRASEANFARNIGV